MIAPSHQNQIFLCRKPVDFRYGFDRLAHLCKSMAGADPYGGNVFLFFNRSYTRAKIIYFDGSGSCLLWKRLEKGSFRPPVLAPGDEFAQIPNPDLLLLLEGVDTAKITRLRPWRPSKT